MAIPVLSGFDWLPALGKRVLWAALLLLLFVFLLNALVGDRGVIAGLRARDEHDRLAEQLEQIRTENARMRAEVQRLREDPSTIEELARRDLGLMNPGEKLFIVRDVPQPDPRVPARHE
jgi:cell division protein FtsB